MDSPAHVLRRRTHKNLSVIEAAEPRKSGVIAAGLEADARRDAKRVTSVGNRLKPGPGPAGRRIESNGRPEGARIPAARVIVGEPRLGRRAPVAERHAAIAIVGDAGNRAG